MDYFVKNFLFQLKKGKKKRSRSNDFRSDEYPYSILYSDPRISEYSDTRSSPSSNHYFPWESHVFRYAPLFGSLSVKSSNSKTSADKPVLIITANPETRHWNNAFYPQV